MFQKNLLPLQPISRKVGRVIDRAGLEIRYTPFGYRGFESLTFRQEHKRGLNMSLFLFLDAIHYVQIMYSTIFNLYSVHTKTWLSSYEQLLELWISVKKVLLKEIFPSSFLVSRFIVVPLHPLLRFRRGARVVEEARLESV